VIPRWVDLPRHILPPPFVAVPKGAFDQQSAGYRRGPREAGGSVQWDHEVSGRLVGAGGRRARALAPTLIVISQRDLVSCARLPREAAVRNTVILRVRVLMTLVGHVVPPGRVVCVEVGEASNVIVRGVAPPRCVEPEG